MNAEILAVGTELLMGQISNTNAQYISRRLPDAGINVYYHSVVGDNPKRLKECLKLALSRSDTVIMTGGLGPTQDDLTKQTVAEVLNRKMVLHEESLNRIKDFFRSLNRPMVDSNMRQAWFPENSIIMTNGRGTAPGCIIEEEGKVVVMLPGPPSEMIPMFEESVMKYFREKSPYKIVSKFVRIFGVGESMVESKLMDMINNQTNPTIAPYAKEGEVTLRVTAKCKMDESAEEIIEPVVSEIKERLGTAVYSTDDKNLEEVVGELLIRSDLKITVAESCTGGLISSRLTNIPGISGVFNRGIICYSNESKIENLGVKPETIRDFGAVSKETAIEMAEGIRKLSGTDIGLSVTGIAGPTGGTAQKPVGLVYIALSSVDGTECREFKLWGERKRIRNVAALHAFDMVRQYILSIKL